MKENDFICFKVGYESTVAAGSRSTMDDCKQAREAYLQADIARQLTRLADQGDDTAKARDHSVEQMMSALTATPTPDALVEALETISNGNFTLNTLKEYAKAKGILINETDSFMTLDKKIALHALAAHVHTDGRMTEKAGG